MRIYVASSWRNPRQIAVVEELRKQGHEVYDYRHPEPGNNGFHWEEIDPDWRAWDPEEFRKALSHPVAERGFKLDMDALMNADATIVVLPSGRSSHLEFGFARGMGQLTGVLLDPIGSEPELMYKMADFIAVDVDEVLRELRERL